MKYLLIIFCLLFTSASWSEDVSYDDLIIRNGLHYEKFTDVPFSGDVVGKETGKIKNGIRKGEWIFYTENGQLSGKGNYKDDKREGEWVTYHENGQLYKTEIWKDGKLIRTTP